jgi:hypothetical protein
MTTAEIALLVSGIALLVSVASLWVNSLSPFRLRVSHDAPRFSLYKITPSVSGSKDGKTWWIPSFDLGVSFYNAGRVAGEVLDLRIVAELTSHRTNRKYTFYPKWIVDYARFNQRHTERFAWIEAAIIREWFPFTLGGQDQRELHLVLEGDRWDHKQEGTLKLVLEAISSKTKAWEEKASYELHVSEDMFESKSTYVAYDKNAERLRELKV